ncbi:MAG: guanylate kinase [Saprospiraceae bacterium]|nr:guanylate kinase [Saprospiraceae bacterium]
MHKMFIVTAPSGAGKTTIVQHLLATFPDLAFSVSATTRQPRTHEINGREYYFMSIKEFQDKIAKEAFIEYEQVYENQYYGTLKSEVDRLWAEGKSVIFDIDVQGALHLKKIYGEEALSIFIAPPSLKVLKERLKNRKTENKTSFAKRMRKVRFELSFKDKFDKVIVNNILDIALAEAENIVASFIK